MYEYKVQEVVSVYDGDTCVLKVDLGFGVTKTEKFRLAFINAPEMGGEERSRGLISRDWLRERLGNALPGTITVKTFKDIKGKYGRYIAEIFIDGVSVNKQMLAEGLAESYSG